MLKISGKRYLQSGTYRLRFNHGGRLFPDLAERYVIVLSASVAFFRPGDSGSSLRPPSYPASIRRSRARRVLQRSALTQVLADSL